MKAKTCLDGLISLGLVEKHPDEDAYRLSETFYQDLKSSLELALTVKMPYPLISSIVLTIVKRAQCLQEGELYNYFMVIYPMLPSEFKEAIIEEVIE